MWTLITIALAALLWLLDVTLGAEADAIGGLQGPWLHRLALGVSVLAGVQLLQRLLTQALRNAGGGGTTSDLLQALLRVLLYLVAAMLYLRLGLQQDISSVLATSAMLSVIIGLALQPTLGHLFAGVSIELERPLRVGDFVRRDQLEGQVVSLNWRSVYLRTARGSTVVMPNSEFTSRALEIIAHDRPYRQDVAFHLSSRHAPGQVVRIAMAVLRSELPGVCEHPAPSVLLLGDESPSGTLRYSARFFTLDYLRRGSQASNFLERLWYALSREGLTLQEPPLAWLAPGVAQQHLAGDSQASGLLAPHAPPGVPVVPEQAFDGLPPALRAALLATAQPLRFGRHERCAPGMLKLVLHGRLREAQPLAAAQTELNVLLLRLTQDQGEPGPRRLPQDLYLPLLEAGSLALGPLAVQLCQRIAGLTEDGWLAYHALAMSLPDEPARQRLLARAPRRPMRAVQVGQWVGWAAALALQPEAEDDCRASQDSLLLVWPAGLLRQALRSCEPADLAALAGRLRQLAPGCADLDPAALHQADLAAA